MKDEFNLSEKEIDYSQYPLSTSAFLREDVKEFIRLLKEKINSECKMCIEYPSVIDLINFYAGDKLI